MRYGSVCSGIEAATVAWHPLGWEPQWFSEVAPFPCRVLKHHYPHVPNLGDMTQLLQNEIFRKSTIDLLVGGTPCQSFSLAGLRGGLDDERGNLALEFCRLLISKRPRWFLWENVPGVFSSFTDDPVSKVYTGYRGDVDPIYGEEGEYDITQTADFATLLSAFRECGYSSAWRVLDAQYFGVPQRRRRIFVVGYLGKDWRPPFAVLFERQSLQRHSAPRREKGQEVAGTIVARTQGGGFPGTDESLSGYVQPVTVATLDASYGRLQGTSVQDLNHGHSHLVPVVYDLMQIANATNGSNPKPGDPAPPLVNNGHPPVLVPVIYDVEQLCRPSARVRLDPAGIAPPLLSRTQGPVLHYQSQIRVSPTLTAYNLDSRSPQSEEQQRIVAAVHACTNAIRRLTPLECERLQGFPDHYTALPKAKDSPRYEALGNSMAVVVMSWLGKRIDRVDQIIQKIKL